MYDNFYDVFDLISKLEIRRSVVKQQLEQWKAHVECDCQKTPLAPCCVLQTELGALDRYLCVLQTVSGYAPRKDVSNDP